MNARRTRRWTSTPTRPALPYYGSKWRLSSWIRTFMPPHEVYCEPFGGSASLLLRNEPAKLDVFYDIDDQVVNFFRVLRDEEDRRRLCALLELTPYAKAEFTVARRRSNSPQLDRVEQARELFIRGWQGFGPGGASTDKSVGWARSVAPLVSDQVGRWLRAIPNLDEVAAPAEAGSDRARFRLGDLRALRLTRHAVLRGSARCGKVDGSFTRAQGDALIGSVSDGGQPRA